MKITKSLIFKIVMLILIVFVIYNQIKITRMVIQKAELLDSDPLVYGAKRFGINECSCFVSEGVMIYFNQNESKTIIQQKFNIPKLNISIDGE